MNVLNNLGEVYSQALLRLRNHSNLPNTGLPESESWCFTLYAIDRDKRSMLLNTLYKALIMDFQIINLSLNGPTPSGPVIDERANHVDRGLSYAVSGLLNGGWQYHVLWTRQQSLPVEFLNELSRYLLLLGSAWDSVLAGDIDNVREEAERDYAGRFDEDLPEEAHA